jgi:hypothetical protein
MILEFYNGYNLKFAIEDQVRLKGILSDVSKFITHFNSIIDKHDKTDQELSALEAEGAKLPIFFRETFVLSRKNAFLSVWKDMADSIIKATPVLNMELKARKPE